MDIKERSQIPDDSTPSNELVDRQQIIETLAEGLIIQRSDGIILEFNPAAEEILGLPKEKIIGQTSFSPVWQTIYENGAPYPGHKHPSMITLQTGQRLVDQRMGIIRADGLLRWVSINTRPVWDNDQPKPDAVIITFRDITTHKQTDDNLQTTTGLLQTIFNHTHLALAYLDAGFNFIRVNRAYAAADNQTPDFFAGKHYFNLYPNPEVKDLFQQVLATGQPYVDTARPFSGAGGTTYWDWRLAPVIDNNAATGLILSALDVTGRVEAKEELRNYTRRLEILHRIDQGILAARSIEAITEALLENIFELIPCEQISIWEFNFETNVARLLVRFEVNQRDKVMNLAVSIDGVNFDALSRGKIIINADVSASPDKLLFETLLLEQGMQSCMAAPLMIHSDLIGTISFAATRTRAFTAAHTTVAVEIATSLAIAIRQTRLYQQICRDAEVKAILLQEVNHRVNNNLSAIIGLLTLEQQNVSDPTYRNAMLRLAERVRGLATVHRLLSEAEWAPVILTTLIKQVIYPTLQLLPLHKYVFVNVKPSDVSVLSKEATNLALIISELTINSIKHAWPRRKQGQIVVCVTRINNEITVQYRDDGIGFPDEMTSPGQTGVGVRLVKTLVQHGLGGQVQLKNNHGALVRITFTVANNT